MPQFESYYGPAIPWVSLLLASAAAAVGVLLLLRRRKASSRMAVLAFGFGSLVALPPALAYVDHVRRLHSPTVRVIEGPIGYIQYATPDCKRELAITIAGIEMHRPQGHGAYPCQTTLPGGRLHHGAIARARYEGAGPRYRLLMLELRR
jgi:hypothetical protein